MRIAFLTPYLPVPANTGGKIRSYYLLRALARHHDVDLFTTYYGATPHANGSVGEICRVVHQVRLEKNGGRTRWSALWDELPNAIEHFQTPEALREVRDRLSSTPYDLVVADEICMAPYVEGVSRPRIVMRQKVDHLHYRLLATKQRWGVRRVEQLMDARKFRSFEQRYMASFDGAVSCSQDDADFIQDLTPGLPVTVIGNGVDLEYFRPTPMPVSGPPKLLYLGSMNYEPNIDAVDHFFRRIHPHLVSLVPDVEVQVVGHGPPPAIRAWERLPGVTVTGAVSDVRPYIEACTALIVPLRFGGGTRLKILEAIAAGRPVVSTSIGAEGLGLGHGEHLLLADEPTAFARETARLVHDAALRRRLTEASRPVVAERFAWSALGASLEELCRVTVRRVTR